MLLRTMSSHAVVPTDHGGGLLAEAMAAMPRSKTASAIQELPEAEVHKMARAMGMELHRVAGNVFENPAKRDFWAVKDGALVRLTGASTEVSDDEHMDPASPDDPEGTLNSIMADLEF